MGYFGSKTQSGLRQAIVAAMPPHDVYIETHLGSGAVMLAKPPAARQIGVDMSSAAIDAFRAGLTERQPFMFADLAEVRGERLELHTGDAVAFLDKFDWRDAGRVLIYADPPYVLASRTSDKRYPHDYGDDDHRRLIGKLSSLPVSVMLSGYPSALYDELVGDWRRVDLQVMTRGGPRTECLWLNFPAGDVAWAQWQGTNFTDRQRIKRKAARWAANYEALPEGERLAVLAAIMEVAGKTMPIRFSPMTTKSRSAP